MALWRCNGRDSWLANFAEEFNAAVKVFAKILAAVAKGPAFANSHDQKNANGYFFVGGEFHFSISISVSVSVSLAVARLLENKIRISPHRVKIFFQKKIHNLKDFSLHRREVRGAA